ncbi:MAG: YegP family protein [Oscillospiraceae bacterium]
MGKFLVKQVNTGIKFNLIASNGEPIGTSEVYSSKSACLHGIESVRKNAPIAKIEDQTLGESATNPKFEIYEDKGGEFRFRLKASNGEPILASEGYTSKSGCKNGIGSVVRNAPDSPVVEE